MLRSRKVVYKEFYFTYRISTYIELNFTKKPIHYRKHVVSPPLCRSINRESFRPQNAHHSQPPCTSRDHTSSHCRCATQLISVAAPEHRRHCLSRNSAYNGERHSRNHMTKEPQPPDSETGFYIQLSYIISCPPRRLCYRSHELNLSSFVFTVSRAFIGGRFHHGLEAQCSWWCTIAIPSVSVPWVAMRATGV
jgi:hypothetical protein